MYVRGGEVTVRDAHGAPATVPFWLGEAPGRTAELSAELSRTARGHLGDSASESVDARGEPGCKQETRRRRLGGARRRPTMSPRKAPRSA